VDGLTPLVIQDFCARQTASLLLVTKWANWALIYACLVWLHSKLKDNITVAIMKYDAINIKVIKLSLLTLMEYLHILISWFYSYLFDACYRDIFAWLGRGSNLIEIYINCRVFAYLIFTFQMH
jgi:hypothetical protein